MEFQLAAVKAHGSAKDCSSNGCRLKSREKQKQFRPSAAVAKVVKRRAAASPNRTFAAGAKSSLRRTGLAKNTAHIAQKQARPTSRPAPREKFYGPVRSAHRQALGTNPHNKRRTKTNPTISRLGASPTPGCPSRNSNVRAWRQRNLHREADLRRPSVTLLSRVQPSDADGPSHTSLNSELGSVEEGISAPAISSDSPSHSVGRTRKNGEAFALAAVVVWHLRRIECRKAGSFRSQLNSFSNHSAREI